MTFLKRRRKNEPLLASSLPWPLLGILFASCVAAGCKDTSISTVIDNLGAAKFLRLKNDEPPVFQQVAPVELKPDDTISIPIKLDRKANDGAIALSLEGLPTGIEGKVREIPAGSSSTELTLHADASLGDSDLTTACTVAATTGTHTARVRVPIQVPRVPRPSISIDTPFILQPGTVIELPIPVQRNGYEEAINLAVEQCPDGITVTVPTVPPVTATVPALLTVPLNVADGMTSFLIAWTSFGRKMTAEIPLLIARTPLTVESPVVVRLKPSESGEARIHLGRPAYQGPVSVEFVGLPANVRASSTNIPAGENDGVIRVTAEPAARAEYAVTGLDVTGGHVKAKGLLVIRVLDDTDPSVLPPVVATALEGASSPKAGGIDARLSENAKDALDRFYGTTGDSKRAVTNGLRWLASRQLEDGGWEPNKAAESSAVIFPQASSQQDDNEDDPDGRVAIAVLPFLAEGISHDTQFVRLPEFAEYAQVAKKALVYLAKRQVATPGPDFGRVGKTISSHLLCLNAFSEAYALSKNEKLKQHAKKATDYLAAQQAKNGGWGNASGVNVIDTAQALIALKSARACKVGVSSTVLRKAEKFLATCWAGPETHRSSRYSLRPGDSVSPEATAAGLLAALYAAPKPSPDTLIGCSFLAEFTSAFHAAHTDLSASLLLLTTQALKNVEGEGFDRWNAAFRTFLTRNQVQDGELAGSWNFHIFSNETDRVHASSMAILCLQSNYSYLPLFRTVSGETEASEAPSDDEPAEDSATK